MHNLERRDPRVPLEQRRYAAGQLVRQPIQLPDGVDLDLTVVSVDDVRAQFVWPARWNWTMRSAGTSGESTRAVEVMVDADT